MSAAYVRTEHVPAAHVWTGSLSAAHVRARCLPATVSAPSKL